MSPPGPKHADDWLQPMSYSPASEAPKVYCALIRERQSALEGILPRQCLLVTPTLTLTLALTPTSHLLINCCSLRRTLSSLARPGPRLAGSRIFPLHPFPCPATPFLHYLVTFSIFITSQRSVATQNSYSCARSRILRTFKRH